MKNFLAKFNLIFTPFLVLCVLTTVTYTFLHWFLFIRLEVFRVDEEVLNFWLPMVLPAIPVLLWIRPRLKLLNLKSKNIKSDPMAFYVFLAWIVFAAPLLIAQEYIITATGKLTVLNSVDQISTSPKTKYYEFNHFYIDKNLVRPKVNFSVSGKYGENFDMAIYMPCPIFSEDHNHSKSDSLNLKQHNPSNKVSNNIATDTNKTTATNKALFVIDGKIMSRDSVKYVSPSSIERVTVLKGTAAVALYGDRAKYGVILITTKNYATRFKTPDLNSNYTPVAWLAVKYTETISNNLSSDKKEQEYRNFATSSEKKFDAVILDNFIYLDRLSYSADVKNYDEAILKTGVEHVKQPIIMLSPVNEAFEARNGHKLAWLFGSTGIGSLVFLIALLFKPLRANVEEADAITQIHKDRSQSLAFLKGFFSLQGNVTTTRFLITINLLVYVIMVFAGLGVISFSTPDLLKWGADYRPYIQEGQYWRLLTSMFLHGGLMHVLFNMYGLFLVGVFLEPLIGAGKFLITYVLTGIISSLTSIWWHTASVSVGASGAIFGMYGVFFALLIMNLFPAGQKKVLLINASVFIGVNLLFGLTGSIDNAAHVGGLVSGLFAGYIIYLMLRDKVSLEQAGDKTQQIVDELTNKPNNQ